MRRTARLLPNSPENRVVSFALYVGLLQGLYMPGNVISKRLERFITQNIASVENLEILLLLCEGEDEIWTVDDIFKKIQSRRDSIAKSLQRMLAQGFLQRDEKDPSRYRYQPSSSELASGVVELQKAYRHARVRVIEMIFADPFKLKKEK